MPTVQDVLTRALSTLGEAEKPPSSNRVRFWDEIGMSSYQGQPWCGAWVTWVMQPLFPGIRFVYCPAGKQAFAQRGQLHDTPQPGDVVFYEWEHDVLVDHTGIVETVGDGFIVAIEGNTTAAGNYSDGGAVLRRTRDKSVWAGFGRPAYQGDDDMTDAEKAKLADDITKAVMAGIGPVLDEKLKALGDNVNTHLSWIGPDGYKHP